MVEFWIFTIFAVTLLTCVIMGLPILYALVIGYFLFFTYGVQKRKSVIQVLKLSLSGIQTVKNILVTFVLIGIITAVWRASGTISFIVYYATKAFSPSSIILMTFLMCCLISVLTGTAFGTAATIGVICVTMANSMGIPFFYTGGAVLAGAYFGDRCSPVSTSALLVSELTNTNIFRNISNMIKTSLVPFAVSCLLYFIAGLSFHTTQGSANIQLIFADCFDLNFITLLPAAIIVLLSLFRLNVKIIMSISIAAGVVSAIFIQNMDVLELIRIAVFGYHPENVELAALLSGGGVLSMGKVFAIVCISSCYAGIFNGTGFLDKVRETIYFASRKLAPFCVILLTSVLTGLIACNQTLTIMLAYQLCKNINDTPEMLALHLENSAVVVAPLIPWSIAGGAVLSLINAPSVCILTACYLYLLPLWNMICAVYQKRHFSASAPQI